MSFWLRPESDIKMTKNLKRYEFRSLNQNLYTLHCILTITYTQYMITLVTTTRKIRTISKWATVVLGSITLLVVLIRTGLWANELFFPKPPPPPEQGFGQLPQLDFSSEKLTEYTYRINTISGFLPVLSDREKVYKFVEPQNFILTVFPIRDKLGRIKFTQNEKKLDEITYSWNNSINTGQIIIYNIVNNSFEIKYDFINDTNILNSSFVSPKAQTIAAVQKILGDIGEDTTDLDFDNSRFTFYRIENADPQLTRLVEVEERENPNVVKIDLKQLKINNMSLIYKDDKDYPMHFYIASFPPDKPEILSGFYYHNRVVSDQNSSYPLKLAEYALNDLKKGNALLIKTPASSKIDILDIYLAYYINKDEKYLRPVFVFEGKDFMAIVDAILQTSPQSPKKKPS